jgi:nicotinamide-nucleotide amidase
MKQNINAEVISIGTEILLGEITDTNSVFIARQLRDLGINLYYMTSVGDNCSRIASAIQLALSRAQVVITCGGLGPTVDDMTRQSVADATERELVFNQDLLDQITERFKRFRVKMTENNQRQAYIPANAIIIENPVGTAPSFIVEHGDGVVISLPGVPREMMYLMTESVVPYLQKKYDLGIIKARTLRTAGIGESMLDDMIGTELLEGSNPTVGLAAHNGQVDVRITAKAENLAAAMKMLDATEAQLQARIGEYVFGYDRDVLENVLVDDLKKHGLKVAVCEVGLVGAISEVITKQDSAVMSLVQSYASIDDLKAAMHATTYDLRELALSAAQHLQHRTQSVVSIAVVSLPDVDENTDVEESTVVTVLVGNINRTRGYGFGGQSGFSKKWVSTWALAQAWRMLKEGVLNA